MKGKIFLRMIVCLATVSGCCWTEDCGCYGGSFPDQFVFRFNVNNGPGSYKRDEVENIGIAWLDRATNVPVDSIVMRLDSENTYSGTGGDYEFILGITKDWNALIYNYRVSVPGIRYYMLEDLTLEYESVNTKCCKCITAINKTVLLDSVLQDISAPRSYINLTR